jgi:hypothetical protein
MKRFFFLFILVSLLFNGTVSADDIIIVPTQPQVPSPYPRAPRLIPVTADLSATDIYLNFTTTVGVATITITDSNGITVYQQLMDTDTTNELYIPVDTMDAGSYTITITYGSVTLAGVFMIP